ncbi:MAG: SDR family oxidoreductase [Bifidobacteriaceae bacterium]|nr:SDR family oxidoreductase [Bifidobacteriaceae bacterium]
MSATNFALVGGATSGLGLASARALAAAGHDVLLWSRDQGGLDAVAEDLRTRHPGRSFTTVAADATDPGTAALVADAALAAGGPAVVVLNQGGPPPVDPAATDADGWRRAFQMLAITPIELATRLLPPMRAAGFGRIIAILSSGVVEPIPTLAYSNAARAALMAWLKTAAGAVAADGVTLNGVMPGRIATPRVASLDQAAAARTGKTVEQVQAASAATIPAGRYGTPEEFAAMVAFLASPAASYITGHAHAVDGGMLKGW